MKGFRSSFFSSMGCVLIWMMSCRGIMETDPLLRDPLQLLPRITTLQGMLSPQASGMVCPIQAQVIPENSMVIVIGDLHGDAHSLCYDIQQIRAAGHMSPNSLELNDNRYIVFTGDYTDRGLDGIVVWNILSALKRQNCQRVFLLKGNHEDAGLNVTYGFFADIESQIADAELKQDIRTKLNEIYPMLTQALFLGVKKNNGSIDYLMFSHGTVDHSLTSIVRATLNGATLAPGILVTKDGGNQDPTCFMWSDCYSDPAVALSPERLRGCRWESTQSIRQYFNALPQAPAEQGLPPEGNNYRVVSLMRGHQHKPGGILTLNTLGAPDPEWTPLTSGQIEHPLRTVYMFMSCPEGMWFGNLAEDSFGILSFHANEWQLDPHIRVRTPAEMDAYKTTLMTELVSRIRHIAKDLHAADLNEYSFQKQRTYGAYVWFLQALAHQGLPVVNELRLLGLEVLLLIQ